MKLINQKKVNLKSNPSINEKMIQEYIFDNPLVLGLGELQPIIKEKIQPQGGRLDLLFGDDDNNRYEVELQLGPTDPSHIIRTIEYWDVERKRYPQYDHIAVIIAEDITTRFQNIISLFNNQIPLIALQLSATLTSEGDIAISFVKVMDRVIAGTDDEDFFEPADRSYWEKKCGKKSMKLFDDIFNSLGSRKDGYELKYNKSSIGTTKDGYVKNFVTFRPWKNFVVFRIRCDEDPAITEKLTQAGLDISYSKKRGRYVLKLSRISELKDNKTDIMTLVDSALERIIED